MLPRTVSMRAAYGRAASAAACARRSFEAATICMALVIFCVALVAAMRLRRSFSEGMDGGCQMPDVELPRSDIRQLSSYLSERLSVIFDHALELGCGRVIEVARVANRVEDV